LGKDYEEAVKAKDDLSVSKDDFKKIVE